MANLTEYLTTKFTKLILEITTDLGMQADRVMELQNVLRALKNPDILVDGSPLTLERLQILEDGTHRIKKPNPALLETSVDTCQLEATKSFGQSNGNTESVQKGTLLLPKSEVTTDAT